MGENQLYMYSRPSTFANKKSSRADERGGREGRAHTSVYIGVHVKSTAATNVKGEPVNGS
jgi:hypothetical protein